MATQSYRPTANQFYAPRQRDHQINEVDVDHSSFMRTVSIILALGRGTLLSVASSLISSLPSLVRFVAILPVNALSTNAPRVAYAARCEEKRLWAHKKTAR